MDKLITNVNKKTSDIITDVALSDLGLILLILSYSNYTFFKMQSDVEKQKTINILFEAISGTKYNVSIKSTIV